MSKSIGLELEETLDQAAGIDDHGAEIFMDPREEPVARYLQGRTCTLFGTLMGYSEQGEPLVDFAENPGDEPVVACSTVALTPMEVGRPVVLTFANGNLVNPIVLGVVQQPAAAAVEETPADEQKSPLDAEIDGERLVFTAKKEIVLRCGKASITLTRAGKVLIRGAYVLSRSSGANRIKGGSIQLN